jgi:hypothetical protein
LKNNFPFDENSPQKQTLMCQAFRGSLGKSQFRIDLNLLELRYDKLLPFSKLLVFIFEKLPCFILI